MWTGAFCLLGCELCVWNEKRNVKIKHIIHILWKKALQVYRVNLNLKSKVVEAGVFCPQGPDQELGEH